MKYIFVFFVLLFLALTGHAQSPVSTGSGSPIEEYTPDGKSIAPTAVTTSTLGVSSCMTTDLPMCGYDLTNPDDIYSTAPSTDTAARTFVISSQPPFAGATDAQTSGSNIVIMPPPGKFVLTAINQATAVTDTFTVTTSCQGVVAAAPVLTATATGGLQDANHFVCDAGQSSILCVDHLYTSLTTAPLITGITWTHTVGTARLVGSLVQGTCSFFTAVWSDATATITATTPGSVIAGYGGTAANPAIRVGYQATGIFSNQSGYIKFAVNGSECGTCGGSSLGAGSGFTSGAGGTIGWNGRSYFESSANGYLGINNASGVAGKYYIDMRGEVKGQTITIGTPSGGTLSATFAGNPGDASKTLADIIPLGAKLLGANGRVVTAATNCATVKIGFDMGGGGGLDDDQLGATISVANDTLITTATATADIGGTCINNGGSTATGCDLTITANGGNCFDGVFAMSVVYLTSTAATAD